MTELQRFIIRNISSVFTEKEKLNEISKEYEKIYQTKLKDDYIDFANRMNRIWKGDAGNHNI